MLTAHKIKVLQSLDKKKFRQKYNLFLVEGFKTIRELIGSRFKIVEIFTATEPDDFFLGIDVERISERELKKISFLQNPKDAVAVCELSENQLITDANFNLVLDGIQDPGNLGTIIRLADWFGIPQIICSDDTADFYNPKVIQASMGSFSRVNIFYTGLPDFLRNSQNENVGTDMLGENIYTADFPKNINLILGNEGNGIRKITEEFLDRKISIPRFGNPTESLNVSIAAGIILGEIFSRKF
ncbi:RNA methyltransferase [Cruoricaptor ignavus]|uniref:RNA methyltransferase n=1 Tax=Cruoricaptor ignavus TaxID=1118202 RepID=A0A7M1T2R1_9FLAO|nr:RNA methyltransferase [Cruoricaptor ignavus]QOR74148.1 RNA methyltransferase [Cruoricaptor ignavus]